MGMFIGNTYTRVEDVRSKYRVIDEYSIEEIKSDENDNEFTNDKFVIDSKDYHERFNYIKNDVNKIIKMLKNYDVSGAIDELEILAEKLY